MEVKLKYSSCKHFLKTSIHYYLNWPVKAVLKRKSHKRKIAAVTFQ